MKEIEFKITYARAVETETETIRVQAQNINGGYAKALKRAREPLGNGHERDILKIELGLWSSMPGVTFPFNP